MLSYNLSPDCARKTAGQRTDQRARALLLRCPRFLCGFGGIFRAALRDLSVWRVKERSVLVCAYGREKNPAVRECTDMQRLCNTCKASESKTICSHIVEIVRITLFLI